MSDIHVSYDAEGGICFGGVVLRHISIPMMFKSRVVVLTVGGNDVTLTRLDAIRLADAIRSAALDA